MLLNIRVVSPSHECEGFLYLRTGFESPPITPVHGDPWS